MLLFYGMLFCKLQTYGSILLKRNITFSICSSLRIWSTWLLRLEKSVVLNFCINCIRIGNEFHSLLYSTSKADISYSIFPGNWEDGIYQFWFLDRNFATAWRCFSFLIRSNWIFRSIDTSLKNGIEIQFFVRSQHVNLILFEVIYDSLFYFW